MIHTREDLKQLQMLPLEIKISMTERRIKQWVDEYGESGVYVSFSGGKDSTVLLHIVRERLHLVDIPAVFVDTGLEFPEIRSFVRTFDNVVWLKPDMNFKQVITKYGYPFISKEIAHKIHDMNTAHKKGNSSYVDAQMRGDYISKNGKSNMISIQHYKFLIDAPFTVSHKCCDVMKKKPVKKYERESGRHAITGQMASESQMRLRNWLIFGCNAFEMKRPISNPLSFWRDQDILQYIKKYNVSICSVYGDLVPDMPEECEGQLSLEDLGLLPDERRLKLTGCKRTGCTFCGFGCHLPDDRRFLLLKEMHPPLYDYIMRSTERGGLGYEEIIKWLNEHGGFDIKI